MLANLCLFPERLPFGSFDLNYLASHFTQIQNLAKRASANFLQPSSFTIALIPKDYETGCYFTLPFRLAPSFLHYQSIRQVCNLGFLYVSICHTRHVPKALLVSICPTRVLLPLAVDLQSHNIPLGPGGKSSE